MTDRISELPDPILCHILSFLPTKFAATTSILSKRWKPVWLSVQTLDFDDKTFKGLDSLLHIMHSTIFLRDITLPIHSFRFQWNKYPSGVQQDVNQIVNFVLQRRIQNLYLRPSKYPFDAIELPLTILKCTTLKVLKLKNITVGDISQNMDIHLPILKTFHLNKVRFVCHDHNIEKLLLGCPILEDLAIKNTCPLKDLNHLPSLATLKALPNLIKARIREFDIPMTMISKAKILHLDLDTKAPEDRNKKYWEVPPIVPECLSSQLKTCCIREGFLEHFEGEKDMEEVGDECFAELLSRSLIQQMHDDFRGQKFVMHDHVNDLATVVSGKSCYRLEYGCDTFENVRHLSYNQEFYDIFKKLKICYKFKCLRSFISIGCWRDENYLFRKVLDDLLPALGKLRMSSSSKYKNITMLPDSIGNLVQLRYLVYEKRVMLFQSWFQIALNIRNCGRNIADIVDEAVEAPCGTKPQIHCCR
ncbi:CC-NBS-LRR resistance protein [Trifolium pratense]|uniref:CC-NBS-LRR resistance protein n=1 Tax=Trifolium pratense TaxID=57577 RepID=A0A2K3PPN1_TRIPR|nr:CC-NBS-LRR resistance protein [Trifolium pratense]